MKTNAELLALLAGAPEVDTVWVHSATGQEYLVVCCSLDEPTHAVLVTYRSLKGGPIWTRTLTAWTENVLVGESVVPRFRPFQNDYAKFWDDDRR